MLGKPPCFSLPYRRVAVLGALSVFVLLALALWPHYSGVAKMQLFAGLLLAAPVVSIGLYRAVWTAIHVRGYGNH